MVRPVLANSPYGVGHEGRDRHLRVVRVDPEQVQIGRDADDRDPFAPSHSRSPA